MVRRIYVQENNNELVRDNVEDITENKALVTKNIADIEENKKAILMEQLNNSNLYLGAFTYGNSGDDAITDAYNVGTLRKVGSDLLLNAPSFSGNYSVKKWFNQILDLTGYHTWKMGEGITNKVNAVPFSQLLSLAVGSPQDTLSYIYDDTNGVIRNTYEPGKNKSSVEYQPAYYSKPQRNKFNPYQFNVGNNKTWTISENGGIKTVTISGLTGHEFIDGDSVVLQSFVNAIGRNGNNVGGFPRTFYEDGTYNFYNVSSDPSLNPLDFTQPIYSVYNLPDMTYDPPQLNPSIMRARYVLKAVTSDSVTFELDPEAEAADATKGIEPYSSPVGSYTINFAESDGRMYLERLIQYQTVYPSDANYAPLSYEVEVLEHDIFVAVNSKGKTDYYEFLVQRISKALVDSASTLMNPRMLATPIVITRDRTIEWPSEGGFVSNINALPEGFTAPSEWNNPDYYTWFAVRGNPQHRSNDYTQQQLPRDIGRGDIFTEEMQKAMNMTPISEYYLPSVQSNKTTLDSLSGTVDSLNVVNTGKTLQQMVGFYLIEDPPYANNLELTSITGVYSNATLKTALLEPSVDGSYNLLDGSYNLLEPLESAQGFNVIGHNYIEIARVYDSPQYINPTNAVGKYTMKISKFYFNNNFTRMTEITKYLGMDLNVESYQEKIDEGQLQTNGYIILNNSTMETRPIVRVKMDDSEVPDAMKVYKNNIYNAVALGDGMSNASLQVFTGIAPSTQSDIFSIYSFGGGGNYVEVFEENGKPLFKGLDGLAGNLNDSDEILLRQSATRYWVTNYKTNKTLRAPLNMPEMTGGQNILLKLETTGENLHNITTLFYQNNPIKLVKYVRTSSDVLDGQYEEITIKEYDLDGVNNNYIFKKIRDSNYFILYKGSSTKFEVYSYVDGNKVATFNLSQDETLNPGYTQVINNVNGEQFNDKLYIFTTIGVRNPDGEGRNYQYDDNVLPSQSYSKVLTIDVSSLSENAVLSDYIEVEGDSSGRIYPSFTNRMNENINISKNILVQKSSISLMKSWKLENNKLVFKNLIKKDSNDGLWGYATLLTSTHLIFTNFTEDGGFTRIPINVLLDDSYKYIQTFRRMLNPDREVTMSGLPVNPISNAYHFIKIEDIVERKTLDTPVKNLNFNEPEIPLLSEITVGKEMTDDNFKVLLENGKITENNDYGLTFNGIRYTFNGISQTFTGTNNSILTPLIGADKMKSETNLYFGIYGVKITETTGESNIYVRTTVNFFEPDVMQPNWGYYNGRQLNNKGVISELYGTNTDWRWTELTTKGSQDDPYNYWWGQTSVYGYLTSELLQYQRYNTEYDKYTIADLLVTAGWWETIANFVENNEYLWLEAGPSFVPPSN